MTDRPSQPPAAAPGRGDPGRPVDPSLVGLVASGTLDAELAAIVWLLVEADVPLVVAAPPSRLAAGAQLLRGILGSIRPTQPGPDDVTAPSTATPNMATPTVTGPTVATPIVAGLTVPEPPLDRAGAWQLVHGGRPGAIVEAASLEELRNLLARPPYLLSGQELTFLGCVLVLGAPTDRPRGRLRVTVAHYVRPLARDAHGHAQELPPAVLATWDERLGRYEHFGWGVLPEIAARLGRRTGDLEADLHHRRDDLAGLAAAGVTSLEEVRRLIAGYRVSYGAPHAAPEGAARPH